jgi:hypothetical protein
MHWVFGFNARKHDDFCE